MDAHNQALIHFASQVLDILARDVDWGADTLGDIAQASIESGLVTFDDDGTLVRKVTP